MRCRAVKKAAILSLGFLLTQQGFALSDNNKNSWAKCKSISLHLKVLADLNPKEDCVPDMRSARTYIEGAASFIERDSTKEASSAINAGLQALESLPAKRCDKFAHFVEEDVIGLHAILVALVGD